jgi:hypothetical protein
MLSDSSKVDLMSAMYPLSVGRKVEGQAHRLSRWNVQQIPLLPVGSCWPVRKDF